MRASLLALLLFATACDEESKEPEAAKPTEQPDETAAWLRSCHTVIESAADAAPAQRVVVLAEGCGRGVPLFEGWGSMTPEARARRLAESDFACSESATRAIAAADPRDKIREALAACGRDHYKIPAGQEALLSLDWYVVQKIGQSIAAAREGVEDEALIAKLDQALAETRVPIRLPAAAADLYRLPISRESARTEAKAYVVVGVEQLSAAAIPEASLTPNGAEITTVAGDLFPGAKVAPGDLEVRIVELTEDPAEDESEASQDASPPLLLADEGLRASRLIEILKLLKTHGARLAVAQPAGEQDRASSSLHLTGARELPLSIGVHSPEGERNAPLLGLVIGEERYELGGREIARDEESAALTQAIAERTAEADPKPALVFIVDGSVTYEGVVTALAAAAAAGIERAMIGERGAPPFDSRKRAAKTDPRGPAEPGRGEPRVSLGRPRVDGELAPGKLRAPVGAKLGHFRDCYVKRLAAKPELEGTMTIKLQIAPTGRVPSVRASGVDVEIGECVAAAFRKMRLPKPESGFADVSYPIHFRQ